MDIQEINKIIAAGFGKPLTPEERKAIQLEIQDWCASFSVPNTFRDTFIEYFKDVCEFDRNPRAPRNHVQIARGTLRGRRVVKRIFEIPCEYYIKPFDNNGLETDDNMLEDPVWERLRSINPGLIDKLLDLAMQSYNLEDDRTYFWFSTSDYEHRSDIHKQVGHNMATLLIALQSMTDVITNSSSELFICSDRATEASTVEHMLRAYRESVEAGEYYSGDGGCLDVTPFERGIHRNLAYEFCGAYEDLDEFTDAKWDEYKIQWPISLITEEEFKEIDRIFRVFHNFPEDQHLYTISIDHNSRKTIEFIEKTMGGVRID